MTVKAFAAALLMPLLGTAATAEPASPLVQAFAQNASISNQFEIAESQMALQKSSDPTVRRFAADMIRDHGMAQMKLHRAAMPSGVASGFEFDNAHLARLNALDAKSGADFDASYWTDQQDAHAEAVATIGDYAMSGEDPFLRAYARMTLPVVERHARMLAVMATPPSAE